MTSYPFLEPPTNPGDLGQLGHYRVIGELGKGGMGFVFLGEDIKLKRPVALKVMNRKVASTPHSRRRFLQEARAMAAVHHENVATIFDVAESKGTPFMAMELLRGSTLEAINAEGRRLSYDEIISLARQVCRGLAAAHAKRIVHRDIKPANIWIDHESDRVKILDFGLALASEPVDQLSSRGAVVGTPGYLSPEQARSDPLDERSDLYSLGVVLYELCTGRLPHAAKTATEQLIAILLQRPTAIGEINPEIPAPLCSLIHHLLRKEPRTRPRSAAALLEQLDQVESECHVKSEVAQAINRLQLGLQEVVSKQGTPSIFEFDSNPESLNDPLGVPATPSTSSPASSMSATRVSPSRPVPVVQSRTDAHPWLVYWPWIAVASTILVALLGAVVVFFMADRSRSNASLGDSSIASNTRSATPIAPTPSQSSPASTDQSQTSSEPIAAQANGETNPLTQRSDGIRGTTNAADSSSPRRPHSQSPQRSNRRSDHNTPSGKDSGLNPLSGQVANDNAAMSTRGMQPTSAQLASQPMSASFPVADNDSPDRDPSLTRSPMTAPVRDSAAASIATGKTHADLNPTTSASEDEPPLPPQAPEKPMKWTTISTSEGRGADAMVQIGSNQRFGSKPSIGVRTRSGIENNHSYLRFDLAAIEETRRWASDAELVLTCVTPERPVGATLRLFAVDTGFWSEESIDWRHSVSPRGLDQLPLLAEFEIGPDPDSKDAVPNVIRITSEKLAREVAQAKGDTLTLVLAGSASDDSVLRFVSREHAASSAPKLLIRTPVNPPESSPGRFRGRR